MFISVYIIYNREKAVYSGITNNPMRRLKEHVSSRRFRHIGILGEKDIIDLVYSFLSGCERYQIGTISIQVVSVFGSHKEARKMEKAIKKRGVGVVGRCLYLNHYLIV
jgi:predicted GIY-YIG superfamily endonuclease